MEARGTVEPVGIAEVTDQARAPAIAEAGVAIVSATGASHRGLAGVREATPLAEPVAARLAPAARAGPPAWVLVVAVVAVAAVGGGGRQA